MPWASARVSVTLLSLATPPGDITKLWEAPVCDRVVLGRLETERQTVEGLKRICLTCSSNVDVVCCALHLRGPQKSYISLCERRCSPAAIHEQQQPAAASASQQGYRLV